MAGSFSSGGRLERVPLQDGDLFFLDGLELRHRHDVVLKRLIAEVPWRQEKILVWGKLFRQPRLVAWYGDRGSDYTYSGITMTPLVWTELLLEIKRRIEVVTASTFNSVLLNYYRDNRDSMGFHSDDEPELGERPVIASLSLGEERTFVLKHRADKLVKPVRLRLVSGSLLLMKGETQRYWKHGIAKTARPCGPRVNLTFRRIKKTRASALV
jgi:alkylated DNA repair dioxygenase AlkB